jgi:hypothetical protein
MTSIGVPLIHVFSGTEALVTTAATLMVTTMLEFHQSIIKQATSRGVMSQKRAVTVVTTQIGARSL